MANSFETYKNKYEIGGRKNQTRKGKKLPRGIHKLIDWFNEWLINAFLLQIPHTKCSNKNNINCSSSSSSYDVAINIQWKLERAERGLQSQSSAFSLRRVPDRRTEWRGVARSCCCCCRLAIGPGIVGTSPWQQYGAGMGAVQQLYELRTAIKCIFN